jgi:hypothetical protein
LAGRRFRIEMSVTGEMLVRFGRSFDGAKVSSTKNVRELVEGTEKMHDAVRVFALGGVTGCVKSGSSHPNRYRLDTPTATLPDSFVSPHLRLHAGHHL